MVHYKSDLLLLLETLFFAIPLVLGFAEQRQIHTMKVMEHALNSRVAPYTMARVELSEPSLLVHKATLRFDIQLH